MTMHVAVEFPLAAQRWGTDAVLELARGIEDLGYDEIDLFEHVTVGHPIPGRSETRQAAPELLEPLVTLGAISAVTRRLGVGVGWQRSEYESLGVPFEERGRRIDEAITLMRRYWTESSVTFRGHFYRAEAMGMDPKPVQPGGPPIWLGGDSEAALRRVGRLGDGWMAMPDSDEAVLTAPQNLAIIMAAAEAAGRDPARIGLQARLSDPLDLESLDRKSVV